MKRSALDAVEFAGKPRLPLPASHVVKALRGLLVDERIERIEAVISQRVASVVTVVESLADPHNTAAILRTCDGLGVGEVHAIETHERLMIAPRITRGCDKWMDLRRHPSPTECVRGLKKRGYTVFAADMRATMPLVEIAGIERVVLAFGNEHRGVSEELRAECDGAFSVPMRGMSESYNVSVAAAMALYEVTRGRKGDLPEGDAEDLRARCYMASVRAPKLVIERYAEEHGMAVDGDFSEWEALAATVETTVGPGSAAARRAKERRQRQRAQA